MKALTWMYFHRVVARLPCALALALLAAGPAGAADSLTAMGLTFVAQSNTVLTLDENGVLVRPQAVVPSPNGATNNWWPGLYSDWSGTNQVPANTNQPAGQDTNQTADTYGVTILLGEAESGVFVYPATYYDTEIYRMRGAAYGSVNGATNQLIASVRGSHGDSSGIFYAEADLTPLGPRHLGYYVYEGKILVGHTHSSQPGTVTFNCYWSYWGPYQMPRVNPFWRMPDGRVGVLIGLDDDTDIHVPGMSVSEDGDLDYSDYVQGNRLFICAEHPTNTVQYVSHVEATSPSWHYPFCVNDVRPGYFGRAHKALGTAVFQAAGGQVTVGSLDANSDPELPSGVAIELNEAKAYAGPAITEPADGAGWCEAGLAPVQLDTNAWLRLNAMGTADIEDREMGDVLGSAEIGNRDGALQITANLSGDRVGVVVNNGGHFAGALVLPEYVRTVAVAGHSQVVACGARANSYGSPPGYWFRFDQPATFTLAEGVRLVGNHILLQALQTRTTNGTVVVATNAVIVSSLQTFILTAGNLSAATLNQEVVRPVDLPPLHIARHGDRYILAWPDPNRIFTLEWATQAGGFAQAPFPVAWADGICSVSVVPDDFLMRLFRLHSLIRVQRWD